MDERTLFFFQQDPEALPLAAAVHVQTVLDFLGGDRP